MCSLAQSFFNRHVLSTHYLSVTQVGPRNPELLLVQCEGRQDIVAIGYEGLSLVLHTRCPVLLPGGRAACPGSHGEASQS